MIVVYIALGIVLAGLISKLLLPVAALLFLAVSAIFAWLKQHKKATITLAVLIVGIIALS